MWLEAFNKLRKKSGMSLDELSEKSGVPKGTLSKITSGITKSPSLETMRALVYAMGYTLSDLDEENAPTPSEDDAEALSAREVGAALNWRDIDFAENVIRIHAAKESGSDRIKGPKTPAGVRVLPIHAKLRARLLEAQGGPFEPVFKTEAGNRQNENSMRRLWTGFKRELDIYMGAELKRNAIVKSVVAPDLTPYCLRHTFATDCSKAGVPIETVQWLMGHEDISTTANIAVPWRS